jgi:hypothetical protein
VENQGTEISPMSITRNNSYSICNVPQAERRKETRNDTKVGSNTMKI